MADEQELKDINYGDINRYGVNLKYVEHKVADVESRVNIRLVEYFTAKFNDKCRSTHDVSVRNFKYDNVGGKQECLVSVTFEIDVHKYGGAFFRLAYSPYENNKLDIRGIRFNKLVYLNPKVEEDWKYITGNQNKSSSVNHTTIH